MGNLHEDVRTFVMFFSVLVTLKTISEKICREFQNTYYSYFQQFFSNNCAIYEIIWKNVVQSDKPQTTIWYGAYILNAEYLR
jgi:hypothetical protein